jgi:hypothetical protein
MSVTLRMNRATLKIEGRFDVIISTLAVSMAAR